MPVKNCRPAWIGFIVLILTLEGCAKPSTDCRVLEAEALKVKGNAGCWVESGDKLLMIIQRNGLYSFPGGTSEPGETAQCTAHRETYEEAGMDVLVGSLKHQFDNGFRLFNCESNGTSEITNDAVEVRGVVWVKPADIEREMWRFPSQRSQAIYWLEEASERGAQQP